MTVLLLALILILGLISWIVWDGWQRRRAAPSPAPAAAT